MKVLHPKNSSIIATLDMNLSAVGDACNFQLHGLKVSSLLHCSNIYLDVAQQHSVQPKLAFHLY